MKKVKAGKVAGKAAINVGAVVAGTLVGAAVGKPSLVAGVVLLITGAYLDEAESNWGQPLMITAGGMIASNGMPNKGTQTESEVKGLRGLKGFGADAKERFKIAGRAMLSKAFIPEKVLDKVPGLAGLGNTNVNYHSSNGATKQISEADLSRILSEFTDKRGMGEQSNIFKLNGGNIFQLNGDPEEAMFEQA